MKKQESYANRKKPVEASPRVKASGDDLGSGGRELTLVSILSS